MYKFITKLLGQKTPEPFVVALDAIPGWVKEREQAAHDALAAASRVPVQNIRNGISQLQHIVNDIARAEQDPSIHPKLKSIAKNSLPLFIRAMTTSLSRELPDDVEQFYAVAVESVKGCLNSTRGQGRYLQVVFPEEMKTVRTGIDAIGHELNTLTGSLNEYRKITARLEGVTGLHNELNGIRGDLDRSEGKDQRIAGRIDEMSGRIESIDKEIAAISADEGMTAVKDLESAMVVLESRRTELNRQYASVSMTASHVFRKGEKIAMKQHQPSEIAILRRIMDILSDHIVPDCTEMDLCITEAGPIIVRMVSGGEIPLKNKEERTIFSDIALFRREIGILCRDLNELNKNCSATESAIASNPLTTRLHSLEREKVQLATMIQKERQSQEELAQWKQKCIENIPVLKEKLQAKMEDIVGEGVQILG